MKPTAEPRHRGYADVAAKLGAGLSSA